jgi:hypothetical protein
VKTSDVDPWFAETGHQSGDHFAKIGHLFDRAKSGRIAGWSPCFPGEIRTFDDGDTADFRAERAADDGVSSFVQRDAPTIKLRTTDPIRMLTANGTGRIRRGDIWERSVGIRN